MKNKYKTLIVTLLLITLAMGCDDAQESVKKVSELPSNTKIVEETPQPTETVSEIKLSSDREDEFRLKHKQKRKKIVKGSFRYTYYELEDGTVWITKISFVDTKKVNVLKVPAQIKGRDVSVIGYAHGLGIYDVYEDEDISEQGGHNIWGVFEDECLATRYPKELYEKTKRVDQIILPSTIKLIGRDTFMYLPRYGTLNIGACTAKNIDCVVEECVWNKIKVSNSNIKYKAVDNMILTKDGKEFVKAFGMYNKLSVPDGVTSINNRAFLSAKVNELFIPASVTEFEEDRVLNNYIKRVSVSKDNMVFGTKKNALYKKENGELVLLCNKGREIIIPEGITIAEDFYYNKMYVDGTVDSIKKLETPKSLKRLGQPSQTFYYYFDKFATFIFKSKKCPELQCSIIADSKDGSSQFKIYVPHGCKKRYKKKLEREIGSEFVIIER